MNTDIKIEIHAMEKGCPAYDNGNKYGYYVGGSTFGGGGPCKDRKEILESIRQSIKSDEEYHKCKLKIKVFEDTSDLGITLEEVKGNKTLTDF